MIGSLLLILAFQLAGEAIVRAAGLALPGPVLGLALLLGALVALPRLADRIRGTADALLDHLALLFVPAGVGIVGHLGVFGRDGLGLAAALLGSTALAILAAAWTFARVARAMGIPPAPEERRDG